MLDSYGFDFEVAKQESNGPVSFRAVKQSWRSYMTPDLNSITRIQLCSVDHELHAVLYVL